MTYIFIDHSFHETTKSSNFFKEVLKQILDADIDTFYIHKNSDHYQECKKILDLNPKGVILWQLDFLGTYFISRNIKTIIIPMLDGSGTKPLEHWLSLKEAHFINFSSYMHLQIESLGLRSTLLKYFPQPINSDRYPIIASNPGELSIYYWCRRSTGLVTLENIAQLLGNLDSYNLHIHYAEDDSQEDKLISVDKLYSTFSTARSITISTWMKSKQQVLQQIDNADIYIAPRDFEGIGMSFLEAMSLGKVVVAPNRPTHNEYIIHGLNGLLYDEALYLDPSFLQKERLNAIRKNVKTTSRLLRDKYEQSLHRLRNELMDFIDKDINSSNSIRKLDKSKFNTLVYSCLHKSNNNYATLLIKDVITDISHTSREKVSKYMKIQNLMLCPPSNEEINTLYNETYFQKFEHSNSFYAQCGLIYFAIKKISKILYYKKNIFFKGAGLLLWISLGLTKNFIPRSRRHFIATTARNI